MQRELDQEQGEEPGGSRLLASPDHRGNNRYGAIPDISRSKAEELLGMSIPADIWDFQPWGNRMIVRRDSAPSKIGSIYIPPSAQDNIALCSGSIIRVGPHVSLDIGGELSDCPYMNPHGLFGLEVVFGRWAGKTLKQMDQSKAYLDPYEGDWLLMTDGDIWGHSEPHNHSILTSNTEQQ